MKAIAYACWLAAVMVGTVQPSPALRARCSEDERSALRDVTAMVDAFDDRAALARAQRAERTPRSNAARVCSELLLARVALEGWVEARSLASIGGDRDSLGAVNRVLRELDTTLTVGDYARPPLSLAVAYAVAATRAAIAAAQDERDEMRTYLAYAADVATRWVPADGRLWPIPIDLLTGELTLEVDQYNDARSAFERAVQSAGVPRAVVGLARTLDRIGDQPAACAAYRKTEQSPLAAPLRAEAASYLARPGCR